MTDSNSQKSNTPPIPQPQGSNIKVAPLSQQPNTSMPAPSKSNVVMGFDSVHPSQLVNKTIK